MADNAFINKYNTENFRDNPRISVSSCRGIWSDDFICFASEENLFPFLNCYLQQKLTDFIASDELPDFYEWWQGLTADRDDVIIVHFCRMNDEVRLVRIKGHRTNDEVAGVELELVDVFKAAEECTEKTDEIGRLSSYLDHFEGVEFEYSFATHEIVMFRYDKGIRVTCEPEEYVPLALELKDRFDRIIGNPDFIHEALTNNNQDYSVDAVACYKGYSISGIFGRIRRNKERQTADDTLMVSADKLDSFTGLWNKVSALEYAREKIETAGNKHQVILAIIDLDIFKMVNDTYGHAFGDTVISKMAVILRRAASGRGIAARFGGDEFMLVLEDVGGESAIRSILESVRTQLTWAFNKTAVEQKITCTIGLAEYPRNGSNFETIFNKADRALYIGKQKGKNRYIIYKEHLHGELPDGSNVSLEKGIRDSLKVDELLQGVKWCINTLCKSGSAGIREVCERLMGLFLVERVSIYLGPDLELFDFIGTPKPLKNISLIKDERLLDQFDADGYFHSNFNRASEGFVEDIFSKFIENGISETNMYLLGNRHSVQGLICFDRVKIDKENSKKWSDEEVHLLGICANLMGNVLL